jgi:hypothetical protein
MRITTPTKTEWIIIGVILAVIVALLVNPAQQVWDGHFRLTIDINEHQPIDHKSLLFATCWFEPDAKEASQNPGVYEHGFGPAEIFNDNHAMIDVPASGRSGTLWSSGTYNHPKFLVVEFRLNNCETRARKMFHIPVGRGARSMIIDLP